jgi:hypothetical protein
MTQALDLARIDQILDKLEHEAEDELDIRKFTFRLLEQLTLVTGADSAAFLTAIDSGPQPTARISPAGKSWVTLSLVGEPLGDQFAQGLESLSDFTSKPVANGRPPRPQQVWRIDGRAYFATGLFGDLGLLGAIAFAVAEPCPSVAEDGLLALLQGFAEVFGERLRGHERRSWAELQSVFDRFLTELYATPGHAELAGCLVHDLPSLVKCQRVAVVRQTKMGRWRVEAVTGAPQINHRTETIVALERLVRTAARSGKPLLCRAPDSLRIANSSGNEEALQNNGPAEAEVPDTLLLPLADRGFAPGQESESSQILVLQWAAADQLNASIATIRRVMPHLSVAWSHADRTAWWTPGSVISNLLGNRSRLAVLARWAALSAVVGSLIWATIDIEVDFDIEAKGKLEPVDQRFIFATHDGHVEELAVEDGSHVVPGQLLVQLRSSDLELRQREIEGEIATARKRRDGLNIAINQLNAGQRDTLITSRQLAAEIESLDEKLRGLANLQELVRQQQDSLALRCPIEGTVVTWDARRNLESRPVKRGDSLLKVAQISGPWRLRLWVPDREIAHLKEFGSTPNDNLNSDVRPGPAVTFRMISRPGESYQGSLVSIGNTVQVFDDLGPVIPVDFSFDREQVPGLQVNATAVGRIHCGRRLWWYVWSRSLIETVQRRFWFIGGIS